ncbi:MAG: hypothetical protein RL367_2541, partial [Pseudomonadota bacterium]
MDSLAPRSVCGKRSAGCQWFPVRVNAGIRDLQAYLLSL